MWRVDRDESKFSEAEKLAWDLVLPERHLPIIPDDEIHVKKCVQGLAPFFKKIDAARNLLRTSKDGNPIKQELRAKIAEALNILENLV